MSEQLSVKEIDRLRSLALEVKKIAEEDIQEIRRNKWYKINELKSEEPIILMYPENGWNELIKQDELECEGWRARQWELDLLRRLYTHELIKDDQVVDTTFHIAHVYHQTGWGLELHQTGGQDGGAYHIDPPLKDYETQFDQLEFPDIVIDYEKTNEVFEVAKGVFEGILNIEIGTNWWWTLGMTWDFIKLRGLDQMMMDFILYPEWVHKMMKFLSDGYEKRIEFIIKNNLLKPNNGNGNIASGGTGFSIYLQEANISDNALAGMWGFAESQETVGVSPEMFKAFILPYQKKLLKGFGLNCYGCCEPVDNRWQYIKEIPNLRRVSISPWADVKNMAGVLGKDYILSVKPSPTPLAMEELNVNEVRETLRHIIESTKGLNVEIIMKDTHTLGNNPSNPARWVEIAREEISKVYD